MTQHAKIIELCKDGHFHCGNEFRALYIFSPHKRRAEIQEDGEYYFEDRPCEHGHKLVRDYKMIKVEKKPSLADRVIARANGETLSLAF